MQQEVHRDFAVIPQQEIFVGSSSKGQARKPSPAVWQFILVVGDSVLMVFLFFLTLMLFSHFHGSFRVSGDVFGAWEKKLTWGCFGSLTWGTAVWLTQAQSPSNIYNRFRSFLSVVVALTVTIALWFVCAYAVFIGRGITYALFLSCFLVLAIPTLGAWRVILVEIMNLPYFRRRAVIVRDETEEASLIQEIQSTTRPSITIVGHIDLNKGFNAKNVLRLLVDRRNIDMIIMAIGYKSNQALFEEVIELVQQGVSVVPLSVVYENISGRVPVQSIGDQWCATLPAEQTFPPLYQLWCKLLDLFFGTLGMITLGLLFVPLSLLIVLDSPGPIFYSQERLGLKGKPFRIYKFRSMCVDAEQGGRAIWSEKNDTRITRVGKFLRATHLDELPQALNILRGDMSLVGPRPERAAFVAELEKTIPFYRCRLSVKPGLTGWAQVKYRYGNTDNDALIKLQYDLYYIRHQSFMLDAFILIKTIVEVLLCRGV